MRAISLLFHDIFLDNPDESGFVSAAANRYKLTVADFDAQLAGVAAARLEPPILASALEHRDNRSVSAGPPRWRWTQRNPPHNSGRITPFAITVDDGGESYYTTVAERLERRGWRGHCFVTTDFVGGRGFLSRIQIRELAERGHVIGSHSASHPARFNTLPFHRIVTEWARSRAALEDIVGQRVDVASVPGGYYSPVVARAACEAGIRVVFTSEPVTRVGTSSGCVVAGRFTIRQGDANDLAGRLVSASSGARAGAWASWNAKGLVRPLLGRSYASIADWLLATRPSGRVSQP
jgi:peptidoglycan/xylan/chitin deacetylase (PgdA/CDA1 family)